MERRGRAEESRDHRRPGGHARSPRRLNSRRELGRGRHDHLRDDQRGDGPAADRGRGGEPTVLTRPEPGARRSRPRLAGDPAGRPGGAVHDHRHERPPRPGAGRGPRSPHRHADRADSGRQRRALRVERPSRLRRGGDVARRRLRPRPARHRRHVRAGSAAGADERDRRGKRGRGGRRDAGLRRRAAWRPGNGAASCGWTGRAGRRRCPHRRVPTSIRGSRRTARASRSSSATRSWTSGCGIWPAPTLTRVTFDPGLDSYPVWTPDGRQLFFSSERAGSAESFRASGRRHRRCRAVDRESQLAVPHIRLARWHAARVHGDDADNGGGRAAAPAGRHACRDTARADAVRASATARCRPMAGGSPTRRTTRGDLKSTCGRFRTSRAASGRSRRTAARNRCGRGTVKSCSI